MRFMGVKEWCSANVISYAKKNMFAGKFVTSERVLAVLREQIVVNVKLVEIRKMRGVFWTKLYCKMSDLFR